MPPGRELPGDQPRGRVGGAPTRSGLCRIYSPGVSVTRVGIYRVWMWERQAYGDHCAGCPDASNYPYLVRHCLDRGCEIIGHGISVNRMITSKMTEQEERDYIRESLDALTQATGAAPAGWMGPEYGESGRTPQLLAEAGVRYVCDWANDEQPYPLKTSAGELFALPVMLELDDVVAMAHRKVTVERYATLLRDGFDEMYDDGMNNGRSLVLSLHPWLVGQPFRIGSLDSALGHMMRRQGVWAASGAEVVDWYRTHQPVA